MTTWINKDKFTKKEKGINENFSAIADISLNKNPLTMFLQSIPLKSIYDREIIDSRNLQESFEDIDNIKDFGNPEKDVEIENPDPKERVEAPKESQSLSKDDADIIKEILAALISLLLTLLVSYNWYFNLTEGKRQIKFYESFDFVNFAYFFTEYFYKIIQFFDTTILEKLPNVVNSMLENTLFKDRALFVCILLISNSIVKKALDFISKIYAFVQQLIIKQKVDIGLFYNPKNNNAVFSMLFFYFVIEGIISSFAKGAISNLTENPMAIPNPSDSFKSSMTSFKVANPITYVIIILIRIALIFTPTVSMVSALYFIYFGCYSVFSILYYNSFNSTPVDDNSLYSGAKEMSLVALFRRIHAIINLKHIVFELKDENPWYKNWAEIFLRNFFIFLPFLIMLVGLFNVIPSISKIESSSARWMGFGIIGTLIAGVLGFAISENTKLRILQQELTEKLANIANFIKKIIVYEPVTKQVL